MVELFENGEAIDEGIILGVGRYGELSLPKISYKSSILKVEAIVEFINFVEKDDDEEKAWVILFKNPMHPNVRVYSNSLPVYKFRIIQASALV